MSLNSEQMLPLRVRRMRQMEDLLNVEDLVLAEIERIIEEMYQAAAMLHEELVNEVWLKEKLEGLTGAEVTVTADADQLLASIILNVSELYDIEVRDVRAFLNKWLPAHLQYQITLLLVGGYFSPEQFIMDRMALGFESQFWPVRTLNGTWILDGACLMDAIRKADEYGLSYEIGETGLIEGFPTSMRMEMVMLQPVRMGKSLIALGYESQFWWRTRTLNGLWQLDGKISLGELREAQEFGQSFGIGKMENAERISYRIRLDKDLWFLDGSEKLAGKRILDAERREEDLT